MENRTQKFCSIPLLFAAFRPRRCLNVAFKHRIRSIYPVYSQGKLNDAFVSLDIAHWGWCALGSTSSQI